MYPAIARQLISPVQTCSDLGQARLCPAGAGFNMPSAEDCSHIDSAAGTGNLALHSSIFQ
jgi:hypothetical protein